MRQPTHVRRALQSWRIPVREGRGVLISLSCRPCHSSPAGGLCYAATSSDQPPASVSGLSPNACRANGAGFHKEYKALRISELLTSAGVKQGATSLRLTYCL